MMDIATSFHMLHDDSIEPHHRFVVQSRKRSVLSGISWMLRCPPHPCIRVVTKFGNGDTVLNRCSIINVNLDSDTRAATKAAMESGCKTDTFSLAQSRIEQLMAKDSYRRFLKDPLYLDLADGLENGENSPKTFQK
ncbi:regulator of G protein signaling domain protein [Ancylostoma caninum]|uniref:Regulator of G protein signaling domain protein n=1 Tax=Ancylostoma caninum TaxID=29170 RepID=A0A368FFC1_ANCCA|nr:regulator of G protein signaling domain protein [Ancylostoma caninum]